MSSILHQINFGCLSAGLNLLPRSMDSLHARAQLLKIGMQESRFLYRRQMVGSPPKPVGPAAGLWQFERGGIRALFRHELTRPHMLALCEHFGLHPEEGAVWQAIQKNDALAAAVARLNLFWHPKKLPAFDDEQASWDYYVACWRPGKPHRHTWGPINETVADYFLDRGAT